MTAKTHPQGEKSQSPSTRKAHRDRERRLVRLARRGHRSVATWQLLRLGISAQSILRRVQKGQLHRVHHGVYAVATPDLTRQGCWAAAVLACGRGAVLSHRDAAALWGLIDVAQDVVDVTVAGSARRRLEGIRRHGARSLTDSDRAEHEGIPVTSVPRTLLDLAGVLPAKLVQRAYEEATRLDLLDVPALIALLDRSQGKKGVRIIRALIEYDPRAAARAKSELERMFGDLIRGSDIPMFKPNYMLHGSEVDAYWPEAQFVVELDSRSFHTSAFAAERDDTKTAELKLAGYEVLRLTYRMVATRPRWVLDTVRTMRARGIAATSHLEAARL